MSTEGGQEVNPFRRIDRPCWTAPQTRIRAQTGNTYYYYYSSCSTIRLPQTSLSLVRTRQKTSDSQLPTILVYSAENGREKPQPTRLPMKGFPNALRSFGSFLVADKFRIHLQIQTWSNSSRWYQIRILGEYAPICAQYTMQQSQYTITLINNWQDLVKVRIDYIFFMKMWRDF